MLKWHLESNPDLSPETIGFSKFYSPSRRKLPGDRTTGESNACAIEMLGVLELEDGAISLSVDLYKMKRSALGVTIGTLLIKQSHPPLFHL